MSYAVKTATLFLQLSASEKGYLKKFFKTRTAVLNPKRSDELSELFAAVEKGAGEAYEAFSADLQKEVFALMLFGLEEYHKNNTTQARSYISQVEILLEKNLNSQAEKLLAKAKKLARKESNYELLSEIIEWQVAIHSLKPPTEKNIKIFDEYFAELNDIVGQQSKLAEAVA
jgi:hypothetical protein